MGISIFILFSITGFFNMFVFVAFFVFISVAKEPTNVIANYSGCATFI